MLLKRPLLYFSLPGLAVIIGLMWMRRKKRIHSDTGGKPAITDNLDEKIHTSNDDNNTKDMGTELNGDCRPNLHHSNSMPINFNTEKKDQQPETRFGKSAPIDINPNRTSPVKLTDQQIDAEILKVKIQDSEYKKALNSIEEQDFESISPIDLPDSIDRRRFSFSLKKMLSEEEAVIIKATGAPKISPKESFAENKYIDSASVPNCDSANHSPDHSANHSPDHSAEVNLPQPSTEQPAEVTEHPTSSSSPPLSLYSTDSGKGSSPPASESVDAVQTVNYEFLLDHSLVCHLLGRKGSFVRHIKETSGAVFYVKKHPNNDKKFRIGAIEGNENEITAALRIIRQKLPLKRYPQLTLDKLVHTFDPTLVQLQLVEGVNNDVQISSIVSAGHIFCQQPFHPSYPSLNILQSHLNINYSTYDAPMLLELTNYTMCVGCVQNCWYRVQIVSILSETDEECMVKFVDFGGFGQMKLTDLRQMRTDFMTLPFQAIECTLSNIRPIGGEWSLEATQLLYSLTNGAIIQAQVAGYAADNSPEVLLYSTLSPNNIIFINRELVARNMAVWVEDTELAIASS